jgi:hypothetical protein
MRKNGRVWSFVMGALLLSACTVGEPEPTFDPTDPNAVRMDETTSIEARGGKKPTTPTCSGLPTISVTPNPVPLGSTSITVSGTGFCADWGVFVNVMEIAHCYEGQYTSNGAVTIAFDHTFAEAGTYTVGAWEVLKTETGGYAVGALRTTTTIEVQ